MIGSVLCVLQEGFAPPEDEFEEQEEYWCWTVWLSKLFTWSSPKNKVVNNQFCHLHFIRYMLHPHPQRKLVCVASPSFSLFRRNWYVHMLNRWLLYPRCRWLICVKMLGLTRMANLYSRKAHRMISRADFRFWTLPCSASLSIVAFIMSRNSNQNLGN